MIDKESDIKVYVTEDYAIFNQLNGNREVMSRHVNEIVNSIQKNGYYPIPILVDCNYNIIDGQHRFEALKQLNLPVYYVKNDFIDNDCIELNANAKNWNVINYIKFFASKGLKDYQDLLTLWTPYSSDRQSVFHSFTVLKKTFQADSSFTSIKTGKFVLKESVIDMSQRLSIINVCLKQYKIDEYTKRNITPVLYRLLKSHLVVPNKLIDKFDQRKDKELPGLRTIEHALYLVNDIYNYKCPKKVDLVIAYKNLNLDSEE